MVALLIEAGESINTIQKRADMLVLKQPLKNNLVDNRFLPSGFIIAQLYTDFEQKARFLAGINFLPSV